MTDTEIIYDVLIVGGGPAGLSAAQYSARAKLRTIVLDKSAAAGALAYAGHIENYPGLTNPVSGKELLDIFREQAIGFGAEYVEAQVVGVKLEGEIKEVYTMERGYKGKAMIIATGSMGRKPTIKGEAEFRGSGERGRVFDQVRGDGVSHFSDSETQGRRPSRPRCTKSQGDDRPYGYRD
jgi:thioredoxin reductase (NADPH)